MLEHLVTWQASKQTWNQPQKQPMEGGFESLSADQQSHLLKWAALMPPSIASVVPVPTSIKDEDQEYVEGSSHSGSSHSGSSSALTLSPPATPRAGSEGFKDKTDEHKVWLGSMFSKSSGDMIPRSASAQKSPYKLQGVPFMQKEKRD